MRFSRYCSRICDRVTIAGWLGSEAGCADDGQRATLALAKRHRRVALRINGNTVDARSAIFHADEPERPRLWQLASGPHKALRLPAAITLLSAIGIAKLGD